MKDCGYAMEAVPEYVCPVVASSVAVVVAVDGDGQPSFHAAWRFLDAEAYANR